MPLILLTGLAVSAQPAAPAFADALAHWQLADPSSDARHPLRAAGDVEFGDPTVLNGGYLDAGPELTATGDAITVYLRARDPAGEWKSALFCKRGGHDIVTFNLFSVDLNGDGIGDIGFELHSERGFAMVSFPVSDIDRTAWHSLVGRYDGRVLELICDGKAVARKRWKGGALTQNAEPVLIGAETDRGQVVQGRIFAGEVLDAALWDRALTDTEVAAVSGVDEFAPGPDLPEPYRSPVHYRPEQGALADAIPFYWNGEYHVFYLLAGLGGTPWAHVVSRDLVHWEELPIALPLGRPEEPDGGCVFTGSVIESGGTFHIFYTGFNPEHPEGREHIMHATSPDLIAWTKHPEDTFMADGVIYENNGGREWRDPFVFKNDETGEFQMLLCARDARTSGCVTGVATSTDLVHWTQREPLFGGTLGPHECPDLFRIGDTWYLVYSPSAGSTDYCYAKHLRGPWIHPESRAVDTTILYAAKSMFDGKRHILVGWLRDLEGERDGGGLCWGGDQCVPREMYEVREGVLGFRPVPECVEVFGSEVTSVPASEIAPGAEPLKLEVPDNYLLQCRLSIPAGASATVGFREQDGPGSGYRLTVRPAGDWCEIAGATFSYGRSCELPDGEPVELVAFAQGSLIECFLKGRYAFSARAYDHRTGKLSFAAEGGAVGVEELSVWCDTRSLGDAPPLTGPQVGTPLV